MHRKIRNGRTIVTSLATACVMALVIGCSDGDDDEEGAGGAGATGVDGGDGVGAEDAAVDGGTENAPVDGGTADTADSSVNNVSLDDGGNGCQDAEEIIGMLEGTWLASTTADSPFNVVWIYHFAPGEHLRALLDWNAGQGWCRLVSEDFASMEIAEIASSDEFKIVFQVNSGVDVCGVIPERDAGVNVIDLPTKEAEIVTTLGWVLPATFEKCSDDYYAEEACGQQSDIGPVSDPGD